MESARLQKSCHLLGALGTINILVNNDLISVGCVICDKLLIIARCFH